MHHPPFVVGLPAMDAMGLDGKEAFADVIRGHPQVERIVCGHVHRAITRRFAGTVASSCPSTRTRSTSIWCLPSGSRW